MVVHASLLNGHFHCCNPPPLFCPEYPIHSKALAQVPNNFELLDENGRLVNLNGFCSCPKNTVTDPSASTLVQIEDVQQDTTVKELMTIIQGQLPKQNYSAEPIKFFVLEGISDPKETDDGGSAMPENCYWVSVPAFANTSSSAVAR